MGTRFPKAPDEMANKTKVCQSEASHLSYETVKHSHRIAYGTKEEGNSHQPRKHAYASRGK